MLHNIMMRVWTTGKYLLADLVDLFDDVAVVRPFRKYIFQFYI